MSSKPGAVDSGGFEWSTIGTPLTKETDTTYGGTKPGKAPTLKQPDAPDPYKLIEEQTKANRPNIEGPIKNTRFSRDPTTGMWTERTEFSPEVQNLYNQRMGMLQGDIPMEGISGDFAGLSKEAQEANYKQQTAMLDPEYAKEEQSLSSTLANQGIAPGSEAYTKAMDDFSRRKQNAYEAARLGSIGAGNERQNQLFGQSAQRSQQLYGQNLSRRNQLYNELASLMGISQVGKPNELDVMGPFSQQYQGQMNSVNAANANAAQRNAQTTGAVGSLATALMSMFSDLRLKKDIEPIGTLPSGLPLYRFRYIWDTSDRESRIGVMAQEARELFPEAIGEQYGFMTVDYSRIH